MATTIIAGSSAKPLMKMKPNPSTMFNAPGSTGPVPRSLNSGNSTAPTTIIPATRHAARNPNRITNKRPISAMQPYPSRTRTSLNRHAGPCAGHPRLALPQLRKDVDGRDQPGHDDSTCPFALIRHRHGAQRLPLAHRQLFGFGFELAAGGKDVAATWRAHRRGVTGVENVFRKLFDLIPVRTFVSRARPRIERNEIDLGRDPLQHLHQQLGVIQRVVDAF